MNDNTKIALIDYLKDFLTDERVEKINKIVTQRTRHISILLENIFQQQNASAVLRSAECMGVQDIHVVENNNVFEVDPEVAMGAAKWLTIYNYNQKQNNTIDAIKGLKANGYRVVATMPHEKESMIDEIDLSVPTVFMFGTELTGLSEDAINHADAFVKIPMYGFTESFNISVSAAMVMQSATTRIRNSEINWQLPIQAQEDLILEWYQKSLKTPDLIMNRFLSENSCKI